MSACRCVQYITCKRPDPGILGVRSDLCRLSYFPCAVPTLCSVFWLGRGLNTRQACQLFRPVRDMRRRRLAQLLIRDLDITMKTDKSFLLPPVRSPRSCLNSRPGSHQALKTNAFNQGSIFQPFYCASQVN